MSQHITLSHAARETNSQMQSKGGIEIIRKEEGREGEERWQRKKRISKGMKE